jgi:hypothetical protein
MNANEKRVTPPLKIFAGADYYFPRLSTGWTKDVCAKWTRERGLPESSLQHHYRPRRRWIIADLVMP